jgi:hypothetical protein
LERDTRAENNSSFDSGDCWRISSTIEAPQTMTYSHVLSAAAGIAFAGLAGCRNEEAAEIRAVEVGEVRWGRNLDAALASSKSSGKPVFLLFQEVPGCKGCKDFGRDVLSDPDIVQTIEQHFVPLVIPNNQPGEDAKIVERFNEPAWNYQVVRFLDSEGKDLIPRKAHIWTKPELMKRMRDALAKAGHPAPAG